MRLTGLGVSHGVGVGKALVLKRGTRDLRFRIPAARVGRELARLDQARARSREQIQQIKERIAASAGSEHAYLFDAQLLMLDDAMLIERAASIIHSERLNAESALHRALEQISTLFDEAQDSYLRERKGDVADVVGRLCMNLRAAGDPADLFKDVEGPLVLVADEITPSVIAQLDWQRLAALITDAGSWTYHTAILARSIRVPAVAGLRNASALVPPGALVAVDGATGEVIVDPDEETLAQVHARQKRRRAYEQSLEEFRSLPAITEDGIELRLEANIETPDDALRATEAGAAGIGLFRSEFLLAGGGQAALTEDAQYRAYRRLVEDAAPGRVTVRTFDVSEAQLRAIFTSTLDTIVVADNDGRYVDCNPAAEELFGVPRTQLLGRGKRQRLEQNAVDDAEDEGVGANRHPQGDEGREAEHRAGRKATEGVSHGRVDVWAGGEVRGMRWASLKL